VDCGGPEQRGLNGLTADLLGLRWLMDK